MPLHPVRRWDQAGVLQLQTAAGNAASQVVQRTVPSDHSLTRTCLDRPVFESLTDTELTTTLAAIDRLLPGLPEDADRQTAEMNRREVRRQQAVRRHTGFAALENGRPDGHQCGDSTDGGRGPYHVVAGPVGDLPGADPPLPAADAARHGGEGRRAGPAGAARMEYLLGTTLHRGGSWESTENHGPMVDDYGGGSAWCSRFATTALETILGPGVRAGSGYKVANPSEFADNLINYDTARGGAFVGTNRSKHATAANNPFVGLRDSLSAVASGADSTHTAEQVATQFMTDRIRPQPGDLLIARRGVADPNSFAADSLSHTLLVEYVAGTKMSLIEGNAGAHTDRVTGRVLDLSVAGDVEE